MATTSLTGFYTNPNPWDSLGSYGSMGSQDNLGLNIYSPELRNTLQNAGIMGMGQNQSPVNTALGSQGGGMTGLQWGQLGLGAAQSLAGMLMGMKQYGIAKKTLAENKRQFDLNYGAQQKLTNAQLSDRARARAAAAGEDRDAAEAAYLARYGI